MAAFCLLLLLIGVLSIEDYGAFMIVMGVVHLADMLSMAGLNQASQYFIPKLVLDAGPRAVRHVVLFMLVLRADAQR